MEWIESDPLPEACQDCQGEACYNCDHAGACWYLTEVDRLKLCRKGLLRAVEGLQKQIAELDQQIIIAREKSERRTRESWEKFKKRMKEEAGIDFDNPHK